MMQVLEKIRDRKKLVRAAVYARFSSDNQREESIDAQIRAIEEYAKRNDVLITSKYIDKAKSAMTDNRPEFLRMIEESKRNDFDVVLVHKLDRFARNRQDSIGYRMELKRNGVSLISVLEYIDESPESIILESVLEAMAEYYSKNLAREVNKGMRENALKGLHTGGLPPLGYDVNKQTRKLVVNEREAQAVRLMFKRVLEGKGYGQIIDELNLRGYKTKTGKSFGHNSITDILRNEKYIGTYTFNKLSSKDIDGKRNGHKYKEPEEIIRLEDAVPPIIDKREFEQVRAKMEARKQYCPSGQAKETYLLSSKIVCGECGYAMAGCRQYSGRNKNLRVTYRCMGRKNKHVCKIKDIRKEYIEAFVLEKLSEYVFNDSLVKKIANRAKEFLAASNEDEMSKRESIMKRISTLNKEIDNLVILAAKIGSESIAQKIVDMEQDRVMLQSELSKIMMASDVPDITEEALQKRFLKARQLLAVGRLKETKTLINMFIEMVVVFDDHVEVVFNVHPDLTPPKVDFIKAATKTNTDKKLSHNSGKGEVRGKTIGQGQTPLASTKQL
jgi:site-specific DNA recombinase